MHLDPSVANNILVLVFGRRVLTMVARFDSIQVDMHKNISHIGAALLTVLSALSCLCFALPQADAASMACAVVESTCCCNDGVQEASPQNPDYVTPVTVELPAVGFTPAPVVSDIRVTRLAQLFVQDDLRFQQSLPPLYLTHQSYLI